MGQPEVSAGLPSVLGSRLLELGFGLARSVELSLTGRLVAAEECLQIGLINHLVDKNKLLFESKAIAGDLAQKPPGAMRLTKQRYRAVTQAAYDEMYQAAAHLQTEAYGSGEPQAVMDAFIARRARKR